MEPKKPAAEEGPYTEWLLRAIAVVCFAVFVVHISGAWLRDTSRWTLLLLVLAEGLTLALILIARSATIRDLSPGAVVASMFALLFFIALNVEGTHKLAPESVGMAFQLAGLVLQISSKLTLGRSFGILPARRGLVTSGPYSLVRHPIYAGYLIAHIGFLLVNWSWRNASVITILYVAQIYRIRREEEILASDEAYRDYQRRVRWRLIPGIF